MKVVDRQVNLDGRVVGIGGQNLDLIVDPATGDYLGARSTVPGDPPGVPRNSTAVTTGVADGLGEPPR